MQVLPDDSVMVTKVEEMLLDPERAGDVVERGEGTRGEGDWWEYLPKLAGTTITATWQRMRQKLVCNSLYGTLIDGFIQAELRC